MLIYKSKPSIWVVVETKGGQGLEVGYEILNPAQSVAIQMRCRLVALVIGRGVENAAWEAIRYGADSAILVDGEEYQEYDSRTFAETLLKFNRLYHPELLLIGGTPHGVDLANNLARELHTTVIENYDALSLQRGRRAEVGTFHQTEGAKIGEQIPQIGLVRPGDFCKDYYNVARMGDIVDGCAQLQ